MRAATNSLGAAAFCRNSAASKSASRRRAVAFRISCSGFRVPGSGFQVLCSGFRVPGFGFRISRVSRISRAANLSGVRTDLHARGHEQLRRSRVLLKHRRFRKRIAQARRRRQRHMVLRAHGERRDAGGCPRRVGEGARRLVEHCLQTGKRRLGGTKTYTP
jgi:hypothetical protein